MYTLPNVTPRVLVVDDDPYVVKLLEQLLAAEGYHVDLAHDGSEALAKLSSQPPDLVVLDLNMPLVGGLEVCKSLKTNAATRLTPVLIITGQDELATKLKAWDHGADDFLSKPFQPIEVQARCRSLLRIKSLVDELDSAQAVVFAFARAVEAKSSYTQGHASRVAAYAMALANEIGLDEAQREVLRLGAMLHDVGKIGIPDAILDKPGPLTASEYDVVKRHPSEGARILQPLRSLRQVVPLVRWHHERMDGKGYPDGMFGGAIPLLVRMLSVVDVYDALASPRPYRDAIRPARCLEILQENAGAGALDPELVGCFGTLMSSAVSCQLSALANGSS